MRSKFIYVHCPYCSFPQFVNIEIKLTNCLACDKEFEIVNGKVTKNIQKIKKQVDEEVAKEIYG